jgi:hypothetical protein
MSSPERQQTKIDRYPGLLSLITSSAINTGSIAPALENLFILNLRSITQLDRAELARSYLFDSPQQLRQITEDLVRI